MAKIKHLPLDERPRERLIRNGPQYLSNKDLFSIILGVGTRIQDVGEISEKIFPLYTNKIIENKLNPLLISQELGIPITHSCKLIALFELSKRLHHKSENYYISTNKDIFKRYEYLGNLKKENLIGVYLNSRNAIIHEETISIGTVDSSLIAPKEMLEPAILHQAVSIIVCHNHPSGNPTPSYEDIEATKQIKAACKIMGIKFLDHIVIGKNKYISVNI